MTNSIKGLPAGYDIEITAGFFTGAAAARVEVNGYVIATIAYWDDEDELTAVAWAHNDHAQEYRRAFEDHLKAAHDALGDDEIEGAITAIAWALTAAHDARRPDWVELASELENEIDSHLYDTARA